MPQFALVLPDGNCPLELITKWHLSLHSQAFRSSLLSVPAHSIDCLSQSYIQSSPNVLLTGYLLTWISLLLSFMYGRWPPSSEFSPENVGCLLACPMNASSIRASLAAWDNVMTTNLVCLRQHSQVCQTITTYPLSSYTYQVSLTWLASWRLSDQRGLIQNDQRKAKKTNKHVISAICLPEKKLSLTDSINQH